MSWQVARRWLAPGKLLLQCGPLTLHIEARCGGEPVPDAVAAADAAALAALADVAANRPLCRRWVGDVPPTGALPPVVQAMVAAAAATRERRVTPMVAVAGAIADAAADAAFAAGATRVICNNGGDVALRLAPGERVKVGLRRGLQSPALAATLTVGPEDGVGGICTSGLGGRSLTLGIASAVTALARRAAMADAAATLIANHVSVAHPAIERMPAEAVDPDSDIAGLLVTTRVGDLPPEVWQSALRRGAAEAGRLRELGVIQGAVLYAGPFHQSVPDPIPGLQPLSSAKPV